MKLALLYTVWTGDDMDMLQRSILNHLNHVDGIIICHQSISNKGEQAGYKEREKLFGICDSTQKIKTVFFAPDTYLSTKENERIKHGLMIHSAKNDGYTHFIMAACDHFYSPESFEYAKKHCADYDVTFTRMITYYKQDDWAMWPLEDYYMPFIHKMHPETTIAKTAKYSCRVDPSVMVNTCEKQFIIQVKDAILHHYSMVRKDIVRKFRNAASSIRWTPEQVDRFINEYNNAKIGDIIEYFGGREIKKASEVLEML